MKLFRWNVGGDIPDRCYYMGMCSVASECPGVPFLCFTKNTDIVRLQRPSNLRIVASAWPDTHLDLTLDGHRAEMSNWLAMVGDSAPIAWVALKGAKGKAAIAYEEVRKTQKSTKCKGKCEECGLCWWLTPGQSVVFDQH